ncbi:MAG TPA: hypothetical protein VGU61_19035 [Noviherbaspirillum sp.]|jgi:hypothetical protein|uniref:hypothetical protein n=1 Tax=Noviherbaspirillum sp. TaxID=1926288 RepID=UPI002DDCDE39|nr:hypothetical protein [Noviherbaspirillum sp.]HEV2612365.1 hypothetical protein [Noviherbaspirillum sp.]
MRRSILLLPLLIAACATTGSNGEIAIDTAVNGQQLPGANCQVSTNSGSWNVTTPASINVGDANGDLRVVCNRGGYRTSEMIYRPSGPVGSNVGLGVGGGGRVGVGVGLSVPIALGRGGYPARITVDMNPQ